MVDHTVGPARARPTRADGKPPSLLFGALNRLLVATGLAWTAFCCGSLAYHLGEARQNVEHLARHEADESIRKDLLYRVWAAGHGGVYVPVSAATPPNPYLQQVPERDITTASGKRLTLMNPAYMTRQVHELGRSRGVWGHITSSRPIRPENRADEWELRALSAFERGDKEFGEVAALGGEPYYRLMRPLFIVPPCLTCHAAQGYRLGDLRGGISTAIPMASFAGTAREHRVAEGVHFGSVWGLGVFGLLLGAAYVRRRIEEREAATGALTRNLEFTRSIIENEPECLKTLGPDGSLTFMNPAGLAMIEADSPEAVLGQPVCELIVPEHREAFIALTRRVFAGESGTLEFEIVGLKGTRRWLETRAVPLRDASGAVELALGLTRDITARRLAEAQRLKLESQLQQAHKMESVGRLAGGVAHDFNNMLQTILGCAHLALLKAPAQGDLREKLREIQKAAERSAELTGQLLTFARRQAGTPRPLDLNPAIEGMLKMVRRLIGENIDVTWTPGPGLWQVRMDPVQVDQIMANLCVNARDAIAGVGRITIETQNVTLDAAACAEHPGCAPGDFVQLRVSDDGRGIGEASLARIFEPFFTTKDVGAGTGLGLAIVYGIVTQHGGCIEVQSAAGSGTTFSIRLPRFDAAASPAAPPAAAEFPGGGPETVLLVEDEESVRAVSAEIIRNLGYTVLVADSPAAAVRLAETHPGEIHVLLTDVVMPGMNGPDLARRILEIRPQVRQIFMSGYTAEGCTDRSEPAEGTPLLRKPFSVVELATIIRETLDRG